MPSTPRPTRRAGRVVAVTAASLALLLPALPGHPTLVEAAADSGWAALQIRKSSIPRRDRELASRLPGRARLGYHPETGRVRSLSGTRARPLGAGLPAVAAGRRTLSSADARSRARRFIERFGPLFGVSDAGRELRVKGTQRRLASPAGVRRVAAGLPNAIVRFEQLRDGVPVMGGELVVQLTADGSVLSVAGEVLPSSASVRTRPRIGAREATAAAARWVSRELGRPLPAVRTTSEGLAVYDPRLMDDPSFASRDARLVWRVDVRVAAAARRAADHRLLLVDASSGHVLGAIGRVLTAEGPSRRVCDKQDRAGAGWACAPPYSRSEGQPPIGVADVDAAYRFMGATYDFFLQQFGRDGMDGAGSRMKATVRYCQSYGCPWRNAEWKWAQQQAIFGRGWSRADDIVAHEFVHGVIDAESPLFYHYQSGAINESFADVFGELVDQWYPGGRDTPASRWKMGEDLPAGAIRDMRDPTRLGHPDRVRSLKWHVGRSDDGGVHRNSGVGNKAAALMVDGGSFRGYSIAPIGTARTARIWYQALTTRLTPAANYIDLADALVAACTDLAGIGDMSLAHCASVRDATRATQMHLRPRLRGPARAPVCAPGSGPLDVFRDDLEDPARGAWTSARLIGRRPGWYYPPNPNDDPAWDGTWASSGRLNLYAPDRPGRSDWVVGLRVPVELPANAFLRFGHGYSFDRDARRRYDGGILEVKVDGGRWQGVGGRFTHGGYDGRIARGYGNPLQGRRAWTGDSRGWSWTRVDLAEFAGSRLKLRFRMASDRAVGARGWYIDDVRIYTCATDGDQPTGSLTIDAGAASTSQTTVQLGFTWQDASTWVTKLRVSGSPSLDARGVLQYGLTLPVRATLPWDLADPTYGGSADAGMRQVYAQVRDAAGNWSAVFSDEIELLAP